MGDAATGFNAGAALVTGAIGGAAGFAAPGFASPGLNNLGRGGILELGLGAIGGEATGVSPGLKRRGFAGPAPLDLSESLGNLPGRNNFGPFLWLSFIRRG